MAARRPFTDLDQLLAAADELWKTLGRDDLLEAFGRHPRIGEKASQTSNPAPAATRRWSAEEQSAAGGASSSVLERLAKGNRAYERRYGYIFIVCATGKTAEEMLAILERRLQNDAAAELFVAGEEQRKIMHLRLRKLIAADVP